MEVWLIVCLSILGALLGLVSASLLISTLCSSRRCTQCTVRRARNRDHVPLMLQSSFPVVFNHPGVAQVCLYRLQTHSDGSLTTLYNFAKAEENRAAILQYPGMVDALVDSARHPYLERRTMAMRILVLLRVKTPAVLEIAREAAACDGDDILRDIGKALLEGGGDETNKEPLL